MFTALGVFRDLGFRDFGLRVPLRQLQTAPLRVWGLGFKRSVTGSFGGLECSCQGSFKGSGNGLGLGGSDGLSIVVPLRALKGHYKSSRRVHHEDLHNKNRFRLHILRW